MRRLHTQHADRIAHGNGSAARQRNDEYFVEAAHPDSNVFARAAERLLVHLRSLSVRRALLIELVRSVFCPERVSVYSIDPLRDIRAQRMRGLFSSRILLDSPDPLAG